MPRGRAASCRRSGVPLIAVTRPRSIGVAVASVTSVPCGLQRFEGFGFVIEEVRGDEGRGVEYRGAEILVAEVELEDEHDHERREREAD